MIHVFLDVDGVLNNSKSSDWVYTNLCIDKQNLANYFTLLEALKDIPHKIVLSSTWRYYSESKNRLRDAGIKWDAETPKNLPGSRANEILNYVNTHGIELNNVIVLDDAVTKFHPNVIVPTSDKGFDDEKLREALDCVRIFNSHKNKG